MANVKKQQQLNQPPNTTKIDSQTYIIWRWYVFWFKFIVANVGIFLL